MVNIRWKYFVYGPELTSGPCTSVFVCDFASVFDGSSPSCAAQFYSFHETLYLIHRSFSSWVCSCSFLSLQYCYFLLLRVLTRNNQQPALPFGSLVRLALGSGGESAEGVSSNVFA